MVASPSKKPQQDIDTGIFFEGSVPQKTADIIRDTVSFTRTIVRILHRLGIISTYPKSPINIRSSAGNRVEVKLTLAHGTIQKIQESIRAAMKEGID